MIRYPAPYFASSDLRPQIDTVLDQGQIGSCVANAFDKVLSVLYERAGKPETFFSRLYLYYYARVLSNSVGQEGSVPAFATAVMQTKGICLESSWPYDPVQENVQPPASLDAEAANYKILSVEPCPFSPQQAPGSVYAWVKNCLMQGTPVELNFVVTQDFETNAGNAKDWHNTDWQGPGVSPTIGGHAVTVIGHQDLGTTSERLLVQNSWGPTWADGGFFGFPTSHFQEVTSLNAITAVADSSVPLIPLHIPTAVVQNWYRFCNFTYNAGGVYWEDPANGGLPAFAGTLLSLTQQNVAKLLTWMND